MDRKFAPFVVLFFHLFQGTALNTTRTAYTSRQCGSVVGLGVWGWFSSSNPASHSVQSAAIASFCLDSTAISERKEASHPLLSLAVNEGNRL